MFFVQAPSSLPSTARRMPPRCPPTMIRAPPSRPLPTTVPSRVAPPLTDPSSQPNHNSDPSTSDKSSKQGHQVKVASVAVRAAAVAAAAAVTPSVDSSSDTDTDGGKTKRKSKRMPNKDVLHSTAFESQDRFISRASGRNQKYVRDSIENDRPAAISIAQMVAPEMIERRREHYFTQSDSDQHQSLSLTSTSANAASVAAPPTQSPTISPSDASVLDKRLSNMRRGQNIEAATRTQTRPRVRTRSKNSRRKTTIYEPSHSEQDSEDEDDTPDNATKSNENEADDRNVPGSREEEVEREEDVDIRPSTIQSDKSSKNADDGIRSYLTEIGEVQLLDADTEVTLARNIARLLQLERLSARLKRQNGKDPTMEEWVEASGMGMANFRKTLRLGLHAKEHMVAANLRLVVSIAKKYTNRGLTFQDLIQEGSIGLIRGAEKFDANKGFKFSTYATWWIRQAITRAIADHSRPIRLPVHVNDTISSISKATKELQNELGRPPTENELANHLKISVSKLQFIMRSSRTTISLETPMSKDGTKDSANLGSMIVWTGDSPDQMAEKTLLREDLENLLETLTPRERDVVRMRYGFDDGRSKTLEEIGTAFAVTRERIRQIESKALRKLRHPNRNAGLRDYVYGDI